MREVRLLWVLCLGWAAASFAQGDIEAGRVKSAPCAACHQPDGNSVVSMYPKLAGQHAGYLLKQLKDFKNPESGRQNAVMTEQIKALSDQDFVDLAAFFAAQKAQSGQVAESSVAAGRKVYQGGNLVSGVPACIGCHGPSGTGNGLAKFPRLAGQNVEYTVLQLKAFRAGERKNGPNGMMHDVTKSMTDAELQSVAEYIHGLKDGS